MSEERCQREAQMATSSPEEEKSLGFFLLFLTQQHSCPRSLLAPRCLCRLCWRYSRRGGTQWWGHHKETALYHPRGEGPTSSAQHSQQPSERTAEPGRASSRHMCHPAHDSSEALRDGVGFSWRVFFLVCGVDGFFSPLPSLSFVAGQVSC